MEGLVVEEKQRYLQNEHDPANPDVTKTAKDDGNDEMPAEKFQDFLCQLFEKKGVLSDLRAYLRGHIIKVLRSSQTGEILDSQRHVAERLDPTFQALNILITEYFLCLEFSYTLSVFVSEIPLENMVYEFAKTLHRNSAEVDTPVKFTDKDVWAILKHLGIKCDSSHATSIVEAYQSQVQLPLLLCILKCKPVYSEDEDTETSIVTDDSVVSLRSSQSNSRRKVKFERPLSSPTPHCCKFKCAHYARCTTCKGRFMKLVEYYKKKNDDLKVSIKQSKVNNRYMDILTNVKAMERDAINEILEQLKEAYRNEIQLMKEEEDRKVKRSVANHALVLQKRRDELEEKYRARETDMMRNITEKKKFLWGVARALRDQHERMANAMLAIKAENKRLTALEKNLREELSIARELLTKNSEDLQGHIAKEMRILEESMEAMKKERMEIDTQRAKLEELRTTTEINDDKRKDSTYDLLKKEISDLKETVQSVKREQINSTEVGVMAKEEKVFANSEMSTIKTILKDNATAVDDLKLNNFKDSEMNTLASNCLLDVEETSKEKCEKYDAMSETEEPQKEGLVEESTSDTTAAVSQLNCEELLRLKEENITLRRLAQQQSDRIEQLCGQMAALEADGPRSSVRVTHLARPRTSPSTVQHSFGMGMGGRNGGGEALCVYAGAAARPRLTLPGDDLPFIGVLHDGPHSEARRHIINQWRALRRRYSPQGSRPRCRFVSHHDTPVASTIVAEAQWRPVRSDNITVVCSENNDEVDTENVENCPANVEEITELVPVTDEQPANPTTPPSPLPNERKSRNETRTRPLSAASLNTPSFFSNRDKSPVSVLREAKKNLRNKKVVQSPTREKRDKSPASVLREAKLRLRKLELESFAIERSYENFKKKHDVNPVNENMAYVEPSVVTNEFDSSTLLNRPSAKVSEEFNIKSTASTELNINEYFKSCDEERTARCNSLVEKMKSPYECYTSKDTTPQNGNETKVSEIPDNKQPHNYLEKSLSEFRKLYFIDSLNIQECDNDSERKSIPLDNNDDKTKENRRSQSETSIVTNKKVPSEKKIKFDNESCSVNQATDVTSDDCRTVNSSEPVIDDKVNSPNEKIFTEVNEANLCIKTTDAEYGDSTTDDYLVEDVDNYYSPSESRDGSRLVCDEDFWA